MWTASVTNKEIRDGLLRVTVLFAHPDGAQFSDRYETRSGQNASWLADAVQRRLDDLAGVAALADSIELGPVTAGAARSIERQPSEYETKLRLFNAALSAARQGVISDDAEIVYELRQWLRDHFRPEHLELFA